MLSFRITKKRLITIRGDDVEAKNNIHPAATPNEFLFNTRSLVKVSGYLSQTNSPQPVTTSFVFWGHGGLLITSYCQKISPTLV